MIALVWLLTVAGASTLTWQVISAAGARVGQPVAVTAVPINTTSTTSTSATNTPTASATASASTSAGHSGKPKPSRTATSAPSTLTETWTGKAGKVIASCTGRVVSLVSAVPRNGYKVQQESEGNRLLKIEFERTSGEEDEEDSETHLLISCVDGRPSFKRD